MDLWEWQDEDIGRLEREGKGELAAYWYRFGEESPGEELKQAADLARELDEPWWELFYRHWEIQQSLNRQRGNLQPLREESERLLDLAEDPACQECPQRFCARETVCDTLGAEDPHGSAMKVLETAEQMEAAVPADLECSGCFGIMKVGPLLSLDRLDEAEKVVEDLIKVSENDNHVCILHLHASEIAEKRGDRSAMDRSIAAAAELARTGVVNEDCEWFVTELRIRRLLLDDDVAAAEAMLSGAESPPEGIIERIRSLLAISSAKARLADFEGSRVMARDAKRQALRRGFVRDAAEAALLADEASAHLGATDDEREDDRTTLANCLAQLASRDLDQRARALGIDW